MGVDGRDERFEELFVGVVEGVDFVVNLVVFVWGDEEDVGGGDAIFFEGGRKVEEEFIEIELEGVFEKNVGRPAPFFLFVATGFEIENFDGFLVFFDSQMVDFACERHS